MTTVLAEPAERQPVRFELPTELEAAEPPEARGITRDHKVGAVKQSAVVRKPFFVRLRVLLP